PSAGDGCQGAPQLGGPIGRALVDVTDDLEDLRGLLPVECLDDRGHRPYGPRDVVAPVHPQAEGPLGRRPGPRPLTGAARVIEGSSDAEEGRVEEVLEGAGHVAEVRRGAEEVAARGEDVVGGGLEAGTTCTSTPSTS